MKKNKFTETQILSILKEADAGLKIDDVCSMHGISQDTFYKWKSKHSGMSIAELKRIDALEAEYSELKRIYIVLTVQTEALRKFIEKKL